MHKYWIMDKLGQPIQVSMREWAEWFESSDRIVAQTRLGDIFISTVFLGMDHGFGRSSVPILFETMVFPENNLSIEEGGYVESECYRFATRTEALLNHKEMVEKYRQIVLKAQRIVLVEEKVDKTNV